MTGKESFRLTRSLFRVWVLAFRPEVVLESARA